MSEISYYFFFVACLFRACAQYGRLPRYVLDGSASHLASIRAACAAMFSAALRAALRAYAALFCDRRSTFIIGCFVRSFRSNTLLTRGKDAARAARYCPEDGHPRRIRFQCINNLTRVQTRQTYHKTRYVDLDERRHITIKSVQDMPKAARHDAVRRRREMHMDVHFSRQLL